MAAETGLVYRFGVRMLINLEVIYFDCHCHSTVSIIKSITSYRSAGPVILLCNRRGQGLDRQAPQPQSLVTTFMDIRGALVETEVMNRISIARTKYTLM